MDFRCGNSSGRTWGRGQLPKLFFRQRGIDYDRRFLYSQFATVVTGHGKLRSYLHRLGLIDDPMCPCKEEEEERKQKLDPFLKRVTNKTFKTIDL
jgi:hypothetical protein